MTSLENRKIEWLIKEGKDNDEGLNFFRSLVPYMKQQPQKKSYSRMSIIRTNWDQR